jgi:hypothetical protein
MPYRRLPNTDQARVRVLKAAIEESERQHLLLVVDYKTQNEAENLLQKFDQAIGLYRQMYDNQVNSNKDFQQIFRNARLYVSHFIQVLNLAVIRGEIKKEYKEFYHLESEDYTVPEMTTADSIMEWGKNVIEGESARLKKGGVPLYNPAIAKVQVHYDIFREYRANQTFLQQNTARYSDNVNDMRATVDELIVEIWNQIEGFFAELPPFKRMEACKQFGVIYYYRKGEKELTPEDDLMPVVTEEPVDQVPEIVAEEIVAISEMPDIEVAAAEIIEPVVAELSEEPVELALEMDVEPEKKIETAALKKKKKRTSKQDTLLSLFFQ